MNLNAFKDAELLQREVAQIVGVCRATVNRWFKEQTRPHTLINRRLGEVIERVEQALEDGELPLNPNLPKDQRLPEIRRVLDEEE